MRQKVIELQRINEAVLDWAYQEYNLSMFRQGDLNG